MAKIFKIRDMQSGLFQAGGVHSQGRVPEPVWSEEGKSWKKISEVKSHLFLLQKSRIVISPFWEVVEYNGGETAYPAIGLVEKK
jgi:hypothetical protein